MAKAVAAEGEVKLVAGPPAPSPPLFIAVMIVGLGLVAPLLFLRARTPSPLLGIAVIALAIAGIITVHGALAARRRYRADPDIRARASIGSDGVTFHLKPEVASDQYFPAAQIATAQLVTGGLVLHTAKSHPNPGRYILRFGKLTTPPIILIAALAIVTVSPDP